MSTLHLDAEALYADLARGVQRLLQPDCALVGIWSGGAWLAERLQQDLKLPGQHGVISSALHRDDFGSRGLSGSPAPTALPFEIDGARLVLVDDVLMSGRTVRAALNELFDYGRPASVTLVCLLDVNARELPIQPDVVGATLTLAPTQRVKLTGPTPLALEYRDVPAA